jgi:hypothetical protein
MSRHTWMGRPAKIDKKHVSVEGDAHYHVFEIGPHRIKVRVQPKPLGTIGTTCFEDGVDVELLAESLYGHSAEEKVEDTFPSMRVVDGELRIDVSDIAGMLVQRVEAEELARALWEESEGVREAFIDCLGQRFNSDKVGHNERLRFLARVKAAVHQEQLSRLGNTLFDAEWKFLEARYYYDQINHVNNFLEHLGVKERVWDDEKKMMVDGPGPLRIRHFTDHDQIGKIGGVAWEEAREHWRRLLESRFPGPVIPEPDYEEDGERLAESGELPPGLGGLPSNQSGDEGKLL